MLIKQSKFGASRFLSLDVLHGPALAYNAHNVCVMMNIIQENWLNDRISNLLLGASRARRKHATRTKRISGQTTACVETLLITGDRRRVTKSLERKEKAGRRVLTWLVDTETATDEGT